MRLATGRLDQWLTTLVARGGSDLLLVEAAPPCIRLQGELRKIEPAPLDGADIEAAVLPALSRHALRLYRETLIADASYRIAGVGRFRINLHRERGRAAAAIRALPTRVPALQELHLPADSGKPGALAARAGAHWRTGGSRKIDDAFGADPRNQRARGAAHRDDRGPDRVRAYARAQRDRAGGNRDRRAGLSDGIARGVAASAGRDRGGRDARSGNDADRGGSGGDGASGAVDAAHDGCGIDDRADCGFVPCGTAELDSAGTGDGAGRGVDADSSAEQEAAVACQRRNF